MKCSSVKIVASILAITLVAGCVEETSINRQALVTRHNVILHEADTLGALTVGNGEFAFTADISGLQTFPNEYENGIPPGTQSQWAWHSFHGENYSLEDVNVTYESCDGTKVPYAVQHNEGKSGAATRQLRVNPHRLQLGLVGLIMLKESGEPIRMEDLKNIDQRLDLWTGKIETSYEIENTPVKIELYAHQHEDLISAKVTSPLISAERLKISVRFPYGAECHTCAGYDWNNPRKHTTTISSSSSERVLLKRQLDTTNYFVEIAWNNESSFKPAEAAHHFELTPSKGENSFTFTVRFNREQSENQVPDFNATKGNSVLQWKKFWSEGGAVDFSKCTDLRAFELERRVVLSQYLTKVQCAGSLPPQETGLTMNSWHGKFHIEMHWWHGAHFALWNRISLLEKSMPWYTTVTDKAKAMAQRQGYKGARWQKMTDPYGNESPSDIGVFLVWQQPHPIYFAELFYRENPTRATLDRYKDIVFNTAEFMASFPRFNEEDKKYHLCPPLIPAQEIFKPTQTNDPTYELAYWHYTLSLAQQWRERAGMERNSAWQAVLDNLAPLPVKNGLYLPVASIPEAYTDDRYRNDHPAVTSAYGCLPLTHGMDTNIMASTFDEIMRRWNWETTWGWDYPMLAMTAARLGKPEKAIDALLMDVQKNTYLVNGHNYQDKRLRLYLPGNGGLLTAIAMMAAGWDGNTADTPGFPKDGKWDVRWEGLKAMP